MRMIASSAPDGGPPLAPRDADGAGGNVSGPLVPGREAGPAAGRGTTGQSGPQPGVWPNGTPASRIAPGRAG
ncbi:hypothetical protein FMEAI12_5090001 [Parafrankia sp. Ea1.12]|nr:hypothetical protein FMEAI12_5090001 [Parafrankia sp. Ea1.12]